MIIVNPDFYVRPNFKISPFNTRHIDFNSRLEDDTYAKSYFDKRFGVNQWKYTLNGREAIKIALQKYNLSKKDVVTILTTSENIYISSCVTKEIENFCSWNRKIVPETKLIFVNHEFGYPYADMDKLLATGLPVLEDCCTTFFSEDESGKIGMYGDFSFFSFPKFFPIQIGGVLVSNNSKFKEGSDLLDNEYKLYIQKVVSHNLKMKDNILLKRKENFEYAVLLFRKLGFSERFTKNEKVIPSVLLLNNNGVIKDLNTLKTFLWENGVENSVFYGEDTFFIPNNQSLELHDIDYFFQLISHYIENNNL
jgi:hypothetical protein